MLSIRILLFLISFFGYCFIAKRRLKLPIEITPFLTMASVISSLYCFCYLSSLSFNGFGIPTGFHPETQSNHLFLLYGAQAIYYLGFVLFAWWLWETRKDRRELFSVCSNPTIVLFSTLAIFSVFFLRNEICVHWDEFSHWSIVIKELAYYHGFAGKDSGLLFPSYPPGSALFIYYFTRFVGFSEGNFYASQFLILISAVLPAMRGCRWKNIPGIVAILAVVAAMIYCYFLYVKTLYVDSLIGIWFPATIACYAVLSSPMDREERPFARFYALIPCLFGLTVIKHVGYQFSLLIIAIVISSEFFGLLKAFGIRRFFAECKKKIGETPRKKLLGAFLVGLLLVGAPFIANRSWTYRLNCLGIEQLFQLKGHSEAIGKSLKTMNDGMPFYQWPLAAMSESKRVRLRAAAETAFSSDNVEIASRFYSRVLDTERWYLIASFISGFLLIIPAIKSKRGPFQLAFALIFPLTFVFYAVGLLLTYMYCFGTSFEGLRLDSYERYMGTFIVAWAASVFFLAGLYARESRISSEKEKLSDRDPAEAARHRQQNIFSRLLLPAIRRNCSNIAWLLFWGAALYAIYYFPWTKCRVDFAFDSLKYKRATIQEIAKESMPYLKEENCRNTRLLFIWQNTTGLEFYTARYDFHPYALSSERNWSLGKTYFEGDLWTVEIPPHEFGSYLTKHGFTHIVLGHADQQFWELYERFFEKGERWKNCILYKIVPDADLGVKFVALFEKPQPAVAWNSMAAISEAVRKYAKSGWSSIEPAGAWIGDRPVDIAFSLPETVSGDCKLSLKAQGAVAPAPFIHKIAVSAEGEPLGEIEISAESDYDVVLPSKLFKGGKRDVTISLTPLNAEKFPEEKRPWYMPCRRVLISGFRVMKIAAPQSSDILPGHDQGAVSPLADPSNTGAIKQ
jgi:hypothetical protein